MTQRKGPRSRQETEQERLRLAAISHQRTGAMVPQLA
jgi:hypothetical protein